MLGPGSVLVLLGLAEADSSNLVVGDLAVADSIDSVVVGDLVVVGLGDSVVGDSGDSVVVDSFVGEFAVVRNRVDFG